MSSVYIMEATNLFAGDANPNASNHLTLTELKLPAMEESYVDHMAGGSPVATEINTHFNHLEATFNLAGINPQVQGLIGSYARSNQTFTAYGGIRDRSSGRLYRAKAVIQGRLGRVNPTAHSRGSVMAHEHAIRAITRYELVYAGRQMWYWDFFTNTLIIDGKDINAEMNALLSIPGNSGLVPEVGGSTGEVGGGGSAQSFFNAA